MNRLSCLLNNTSIKKKKVVLTKQSTLRYSVENYWERHNRASAEEKAVLERERNEKEALRKKDMEKWATKYFYIGLPIGILAVIIGALIKLPAIGSGLLGGGLLVLIESYGHYWLHMPNAPKFMSLCIVFILLIWVGYKKVEGK